MSDNRIFLFRYRLQHIFKAFCHSPDISFPYAVQYPVNIRVLFQFIQVQVFINETGGYMNRRFCNNNGASGRGRQRCQYLAYPFRQRGPALDAVGHIGPDCHSLLLHILYGHSQIEKLIHTGERGGGIGASSRHSCSNRYFFLKMNGQSFFDAVFLPEKLHGFHNKVVPVRRQRTQVGGQAHPAALLFPEGELIIQVYRLHNHPHFMISVFPAPYDIQA